jgi:hypothetical protein
MLAGMPTKRNEGSEPVAESWTVARARKAGQASMAARTADERAAGATRAAYGAHHPRTLARRIGAAWPELDDDERREVRAILREAGVIR